MTKPANRIKHDSEDGTTGTDSESKLIPDVRWLPGMDPKMQVRPARNAPKAMQIDDLDEVDFSLLSLIDYIRSFGVSDAQLQRLIAERLETAFAIADQYDDLSDIPPVQQIH